MSDDLRDRIINAIWDDLIVQRDSDIPFAPSVSRSDSYIDGEVDIESVADAVIRELQLREENGWFGPTNIPKHRYVTDWVTEWAADE